MERTSKVELTIKLRHILDMITLAQHTCMYPRFPVIPEPAYPQTQTPPESISRLGYLPTGLNWSDSVIHKFTNSQIPSMSGPLSGVRKTREHALSEPSRQPGDSDVTQ
mmetsp:Transcript_34556/g.55205  ORF Transcript_34556/g.55205 Transcript_34556/m.55205 type:complete len:108 (+) Transcript_34556:2376-2699(+)